MSQQQIKGNTGTLGAGGSLDVYDVPGAVMVTPYSVSATFDGSGASGAFLPCLTFKTQTGAIIARCPAPEVASGDTAEVSWFPHVAQTVAASGSGIQYDVLNDGGWLVVRADSDHSYVNDHGDHVDATLYWEANGAGGYVVTDYGGGGISMSERGDGGIAMDDDGAGGISFAESGTGGITFSDGDGVHNARGIRLDENSPGNGIQLNDASTGGIFVTGNSTGGITVDDAGGGGMFLIGSSAGVFLINLPTSAPGGSKQLWNNGGVVSITP